MKNKKYPLLSEMSEHHRSRLAWRLDHFTGCGYMTACRVCRLEHGDMNILEVLDKYGDMTPHQAKIHATKILGDSIIKVR